MDLQTGLQSIPERDVGMKHETLVCSKEQRQQSVTRGSLLCSEFLTLDRSSPGGRMG